MCEPACRAPTRRMFDALGFYSMGQSSRVTSSEKVHRPRRSPRATSIAHEIEEEERADARPPDTTPRDSARTRGASRAVDHRRERRERRARGRVPYGPIDKPKNGTRVRHSTRACAPTRPANWWYVVPWPGTRARPGTRAPAPVHLRARRRPATVLSSTRRPSPTRRSPCAVSVARANRRIAIGASSRALRCAAREAAPENRVSMPAEHHRRRASEAERRYAPRASAPRGNRALVAAPRRGSRECAASPVAPTRPRCASEGPHARPSSARDPAARARRTDRCSRSRTPAPRSCSRAVDRSATSPTSR